MDDAVLAIQRSYPQVFLACHLRHVRARSTELRLSARDSSILGHLDEVAGMRAADLAAHLAVVPSTLSAALARLEGLGYVARSVSASDRRAVELRLTERGADAMSATSVLDPRRLEAVLRRLRPDQRRDAVRGLDLLATAARAFMATGRARRSKAAAFRSRPGASPRHRP
ncbi:MAG TPA: MarR family winged helix-turn-helix transcriptional regulator [Planctomycetota bacterium]|nr:MarR family winged helix-turn-helix transcriptional regulator [Planctomycetota bacterium]